jgi:hypothetical protein
MMKEHATIASNCPECGYSIDAATGINGERGPQNGDVSLCAKCGAISIFNGDLSLRKPSEREYRCLSLQPTIIRAQLAIRSL